VSLIAYNVEISGDFLPEVAKVRGLDKFGPIPLTIVADSEAEAVHKARQTSERGRDASNINQGSVFVVVKGSRPLRWAEMPLESAEILFTKGAATQSASGWKRRGFVAKAFPRSVRAGGTALSVFMVVARRRA
jgi:hypothetical protein